MLEQNETISGTPEIERLQGKISETYNEVTELNEVENTAKLLGVETFSSTQEEERIQGHINRTDDVTEQNEDENNVNLVEGDKTFSSIQEEDLLGKAPGTDDALNKVENTEKLVEGDQTFSSTQALQTLQGRIPNTEAVTGVNATEGTEGFPGRDETSSDTKKLEKLRTQIDDVTQPKPKAGVVENTCWSTTIKSFLLEADTVEWIFLIISFFLEILAAICDQFFSPGNPQFALTGMWLASVALFFCICQLILKCKKGESSSPGLEMFPDIFGLICGISQWLSTIARFVCMLKGMENPFKVNILPVIYLGCLGARKLIANNKSCKTENRIEKTSIVQVPNNGPTPDEAKAKEGS